MIYEITEPGRRVLILSKVRLWELFKEVFEKELSPDTAGHVEKALRIAVRARRQDCAARRKIATAAASQASSPQTRRADPTERVTK